MARKAFKILDKDDVGVITVEDIALSYSSHMHPDVIAKKKSSTQVRVFSLLMIRPLLILLYNTNRFFVNFSTHLMWVG